MRRYTSHSCQVAPLGGVGEIGMNLALYGYGPAEAREWIIVDVGVTFPDAAHPGVDLILPDTRFIEDELSRLRGIVNLGRADIRPEGLRPRHRGVEWAADLIPNLTNLVERTEPARPVAPDQIHPDDSQEKETLP